MEKPVLWIIPVNSRHLGSKWAAPMRHALPMCTLNTQIRGVRQPFEGAPPKHVISTVRCSIHIPTGRYRTPSNHPPTHFYSTTVLHPSEIFPADPVEIEIQATALYLAVYFSQKTARFRADYSGDKSRSHGALTVSFTVSLPLRFTFSFLRLLWKTPFLCEACHLWLVGTIWAKNGLSRHLASAVLTCSLSYYSPPKPPHVRAREHVKISSDSFSSPP